MGTRRLAVVLFISLIAAFMLSQSPHSYPYIVQLGIDSTFAHGVIISDSTITDTVMTTQRLQNNAKYFWRVGAVNVARSVAWSQIWDFSVGTALIDSEFCSLNKGWSMISTNLIPVATPMDSVLGGVKSNLVIAKDGAGNVFWPSLGVNDIGSWDYKHGYKVYMDSTDTVCFVGTLVHPEVVPIPLVQGWNLVSYLRDNVMNASTALAGIGDTLVIAKDGNGNVYWPLYGINTIDSLAVRNGYQIYVSDSCMLVYPSNLVSGASKGVVKGGMLCKTIVSGPSHYKPACVNTGSNATLLVESSNQNSGDEIGVWDAGGNLVGNGVMVQGRALVTIWGDNTMTKNTKDGAVDREKLRLTEWSPEDKSECSLDVKEISDGLTGKQLNDVLTYETDAVDVAKVEEIVIPKTYMLYQNYPNPFNPTTTIRYGLPKEGKVLVEIFDVIGQRVKILVDGVESAGYHEITFNASALSSGVYFYRITTLSFNQVKKMMLLK